MIVLSTYLFNGHDGSEHEMATEQEQQPVYESPFNKESLIGLVSHLKHSLQDYAKEHGKDGKLDFFLMYAALGQTAFEMSYNSLPRTEEERAETRPEVTRIVDGLLAKLDGVRAEFDTRGTSDLIGAAQFMAIVAEIYCKRRDAAVAKMLEDQQQNNEQPEESGGEAQ